MAMKRYKQGFTDIEVLILAAIVLLILASATALFLEASNQPCQDLHRQIDAAKNRIAMEDGLRFGHYFSIGRLVAVLPELPLKDGYVVCPHGYRVYLGYVGELSIDIKEDESVSCSNFLERIQSAKIIAAKFERLRWNDTPTLEQLCNADYDLAGASGTIHCPWGGVITIGRIGEPPTCSLHASRPTAEQPTAEKEGGAEQ
ncbi:MAG: hypothetical protein A2951_03040 [Candidatus Buchananbacteria bacterium RIFCSPLOWO2_01_FULL_56_15]|uniref:Uncharacterized protein n=1 Tax=Candidatus Buchananbacteria bacterium RIFCSPLOWO2_01_FULL_56_15 TaxID=1797547 RepID=A0A1G1YSL2_9BACT|nr:MAG: hypothetical protein A2951_03040 [Candidatus Buchananbacteria bacterium RIFCSPLOWO2_01_FULL_56_15]